MLAVCTSTVSCSCLCFQSPFAHCRSQRIRIHQAPRVSRPQSGRVSQENHAWQALGKIGISEGTR